MYKIIKRLQNIQGTNDKIKFLKENDNEELKILLSMTYDRIKYKYNIRLTNIPEEINNTETINLMTAMNKLNKLVDKTYTGDKAKEYLIDILSNVSKENQYLIKCIINRDLRIDMGRSTINKAYKNLISKQLYAGCNTYRVGNIVQKQDNKLNKLLDLDTIDDNIIFIVKNHQVDIKSDNFLSKDKEKKLKDIIKFYPNGTYKKVDLNNTSIKKGTSHYIKFPALVQKKNDGAYREISYFNNKVEIHSRSGILYHYHLIENYIKKLNDKFNGYLISELTMKMSDELIEIILPKLRDLDKKDGTSLEIDYINEWKKYKKENKEMILPRNISNGLLNSLEDKMKKNEDKTFTDLIEKHIIIDIWDYVTEEDYKLALMKDKKNQPKIKYKKRFEQVKEIVKMINADNIRVTEYKEVNSLKEATDFASNQMKMGFEGAILKNYYMIFKDGKSNDQLKLKLKCECEMRVTGFIEGTKGTEREKTFGSMTFSNDDNTIKGSVSGFTDKELIYFNKNREQTIGKIISIEFNDLTKARGNDYYALSHPRFIEIRNDKNNTDNLKTVFEILESAKNFQ